MTGQHIRRVGMVVGIREEKIAEYRQLHDGLGVRDLLHEANIRKFSIFLTQLDDGKFYEFAYYEYVGNDYDGDMAKLNSNPRYQAWLALCDPMQVPLRSETDWRRLEPIFFNE